MMRIMLVAQWYPPIIGGEEGHVQGLASALTELGHSVSVVTLQQMGLPEHEVRDGVRIYRVQGLAQRLPGLFADPARRSAQPFPDPEVVASLAGIVRRERPDIVHAHNWLIHSFVPLKRWSRAKLVLTLHDYSLVCAVKNLVRNGEPCAGPALGKCLRCAGRHYGAAKAVVTVAANNTMRPIELSALDAIIPVSTSVRRWNGLADDDPRVQVIPNFVRDRPRDQADPALVDQLPGRPYFLYVGSFARQKGILPLVNAHRRSETGVPLVLIGYPADLDMDVVARGATDLTVLEGWPPAAVATAFDRSLAAVVPSTWREPCPTVVLEAMRAGKAVIASDVGGIPELVGADAGVLVPPDDVGALSDALTALASDTDLRDRLGAAASARVGAFHVDRVVRRIEAVYSDLLARGTRAAVADA
jgi:glycosyltransferase involved in cell wall biosynthesis